MRIRNYKPQPVDIVIVLMVIVPLIIAAYGFTTDMLPVLRGNK